MKETDNSDKTCKSLEKPVKGKSKDYFNLNIKSSEKIISFVDNLTKENIHKFNCSKAALVTKTANSDKTL